MIHAISPFPVSISYMLSPEDELRFYYPYLLEIQLNYPDARLANYQTHPFGEYWAVQISLCEFI